MSNEKQTGTYEESLEDGGTLRVRASGWSVNYYFPGPDRRYSGRFVSYKDSDIPQLIDAYEVAYLRYTSLKASAVPGGELTVSEPMGLTIRIGGYAERICMHSYRNPIRDEAGLARKLQAYKRALERGPQLQKMLQQL